MVARIRNNHYTNRLIKLLVVVGDFLVLWAILHVTVDFISQSKRWTEETGIVFMVVCDGDCGVALFFGNPRAHCGCR